MIKLKLKKLKLRLFPKVAKIFILLKMFDRQLLKTSSHGGLGVERLLDNKCHYAPVDQIQLAAPNLYERYCPTIIVVPLYIYIDRVRLKYHLLTSNDDIAGNGRP